MKVFTIGYSKKTAQQFFTLLKQQRPSLVRLVDVRLKNTSTLAGFTKKNNFPFFLEKICNIEYVHRLDLAPDRSMMDHPTTNPLSYEQYKEQFFKLLAERQIETTVPRELIDGACLLCSEPSANDCHRKMVTDYLQEKWGGLEVIHL